MDNVTCSMPSVCDGFVYFVAADQLHRCPLGGGQAEALTANAGPVRWPVASPAGWIAWIGLHDGLPDVWWMSLDDRQPRRLTYEGRIDKILGVDDDAVWVSTSATRVSARATTAWRVPRATGVLEPHNLGIVSALARGPRRALARFSDDLSLWRGYRGGRMGQVWLESETGFTRLFERDAAGFVSPAWLGDRLLCITDATEPPSIIDTSLPLDAPPVFQPLADVPRHLCSDGQVAVFELDGQLHRIDSDGSVTPIAITLSTASPRAAPRPLKAANHLTDLDLGPLGKTLALTVRGRACTLGPFRGPVRFRSRAEERRQRLTRLDGEQLLYVADIDGEERLIHEAHGTLPPLPGRLVELESWGKRALWTTECGRLGLTDFATQTHRELLKSPHYRILSMSGSPCGRYVAASEPTSAYGMTARIVVLDTQTQQVEIVTDGRYRDRAPRFDPAGRYLYFLSDRELDPTRDALFMDYSFPKGSRPYLLLLQQDGSHPFQPPPVGVIKPKPQSKPDPLPSIDLQGLGQRLLRFPVSESRYEDVRPLSADQVLFARRAAGGSLNRNIYAKLPKADVSLVTWSMASEEMTPLVSAVATWRVSPDGKAVACRIGTRLRVFPTSPDRVAKEALKRTDSSKTGRKTFWVDLSRIQGTIDLATEWSQMLTEAWRIVRDQTWSPQLDAAQWDTVLARYQAKLNRIHTRSEFSVLLKQLLGELKTSHAYEIGGAYGNPVARRPGRLGIRAHFDQGWHIDAIATGEPGHPQRQSPLAAAGAGLALGDRILSINGEPCRAELPIEAQLLGQAGKHVEIDALRSGQPINCTVRCLTQDQAAWTRTWARTNQATVHARTAGTVGYLHIPDMGPNGYAEFHRDFLLQGQADALIVDVRYNRGGHVSQLLLGKLAQRLVGWTLSRHYSAKPYPHHAVRGPMVLLTNAFAGSDGDIFTHNWRQLDLGPIVGTRTWGGTIGIWPRTPLIDGTVITTPEFANWYDGVGFGLENQGAAPDVTLPHPPGCTEDLQLTKAIELALEALTAAPARTPPG